MSDSAWYLLTDAFTNESLARELTRAGITEEEAATRVIWQGKEVFVWRVPFRFARRMEEDRHTFSFRFTILIQEGGGAAMEFAGARETRTKQGGTKSKAGSRTNKKEIVAVTGGVGWRSCSRAPVFYFLRGGTRGARGTRRQE